jgi:hypothetical protein
MKGKFGRKTTDKLVDASNCFIEKVTRNLEALLFLGALFVLYNSSNWRIMKELTHLRAEGRLQLVVIWSRRSLGVTPLF